MSDISIGKTKADLNKPKKTGRPKVLDDELVDKKELLTCSCGLNVRRDNMSQHRKSKKHKLIMGKYLTVRNDQLNTIETELINIESQLKNIQLKINDERFKSTLKYNI